MVLAMPAGVTLGQGWDLDDHVAVVGGDGERVYLTTLDGTLDWAESLDQTWTLHSAPLLGGPMRLESLVPFVRHRGLPATCSMWPCIRPGPWP